MPPRLAAGPIAVLVLASLLGSCGILGPDEGRTVVYEVAAHKGSCTSLFHTLCLQVREPGQQDFHNLFGTPSGFDFAWGWETVLEVEETPIENPPADGSSVRRRLGRVVTREAVVAGATFVLRPPTGALDPIGEGLYRIFGEPVTLDCTTAELCEILESTRLASPRARLLIQHGSPPGVLRLLAVEGCADEYGPCP